MNGIFADPLMTSKQSPKLAKDAAEIYPEEIFVYGRDLLLEISKAKYLDE